ncbi:MAG: hypothetical protein AB1894_23070 [Chloroflexota bacterium]
MSILILALVILCSCSKASPYAGFWKGTVINPSGKTIGKIEFTVQNDGMVKDGKIAVHIDAGPGISCDLTTTSTNGLNAQVHTAETEFNLSGSFETDSRAKGKIDFMACKTSAGVIRMQAGPSVLTWKANKQP